MGYQDSQLTIDYARRLVWLNGKSIQLTRKEYELLEMLVRHAGEVATREQLLSIVWGYNNQVRTRTLDVHVRRLRKKLGNYAEQHIETIFGTGYRFQPPRASHAVERLAGMALALSA
jgi:DNA-binding response OmpR family regulator